MPNIVAILWPALVKIVLCHFNTAQECFHPWLEFGGGLSPVLFPELHRGQRSAKFTGSLRLGKSVSDPGRPESLPKGYRGYWKGLPKQKCLGMPRSQVEFYSGNTAYSELFDTLFVGRDVLPGIGGALPANARIGMEGALAHEIIGHRGAFTAGQSHLAGSLMDEVQASWRAARLAPDLPPGERMRLMRDAVERIHSEGLRAKDINRSQIFLGK